MLNFKLLLSFSYYKNKKNFYIKITFYIIKKNKFLYYKEKQIFIL